MAKSKLKIRDVKKNYDWVTDHLRDTLEDAQEEVKDSGFGRYVSEKDFNAILHGKEDAGEYYENLVEKRPSRWSRSWNSGDIASMVGSQLGPNAGSFANLGLLGTAFPGMGFPQRLKGGGYSQGSQRLLMNFMQGLNTQNWMDQDPDELDVDDFEMTHQQFNKLAQEQGETVSPFIQAPDRGWDTGETEYVHNPWSEDNKRFYKDSGTRGEVIASLGDNYWANAEDHKGNPDYWKWHPPETAANVQTAATQDMTQAAQGKIKEDEEQA